MSMDEDAMFKALLKNKPQQKDPAKKEVKAASSSVPEVKPLYPKNSEDAMYQALLKNKPQQKAAPKIPVEPVKIVQAPRPVLEVEEQVVEPKLIPVAAPAVIPVQASASPESMDKLTASVNMVYGLMRTTVIVLVLMLVVGIAILIKVQ
ncbi:MAG TPA: hypothetical protein VJJ51_10000 [Candidatus Methanoperedens sp.]|nr:hypothetical protein [Candidatus Methanoperedens sp.]